MIRPAHTGCNSHNAGTCKFCCIRKIFSCVHTMQILQEKWSHVHHKKTEKKPVLPMTLFSFLLILYFSLLSKIPVAIWTVLPGNWKDSKQKELFCIQASLFFWTSKISMLFSSKLLSQKIVHIGSHKKISVFASKNGPWFCLIQFSTLQPVRIPSTAIGSMNNLHCLHVVWNFASSVNRSRMCVFARFFSIPFQL